ncbi:MAG: MFS transporter [Phycisphaerales bacterium]
MMNRGFVSLLASQFCGAMNDNILKQVLIFMVIADGVWAGSLGAGGQGIVSALFTLPFILLSGYAGTCADRWSKRTVTVLVRGTEIPIAIIAAIGFATANLWLTMSSMVLLSVQSAFFGPAKYGLIPELVSAGKLSQANGAINMLTNIAVIAGAVAAGVVAEGYYPKPGPVPAAAIVAAPNSVASSSGAPAAAGSVDDPAQDAGRDAGRNTGQDASNDASRNAAEPAARASVPSQAGATSVTRGPSSGASGPAVGASSGPSAAASAARDVAGGANPLPAAATESGAAVRPLRPWFPGIILIIIAIGGLLAAVPIPRLPARRPGLPFDVNPLATYLQSVRAMREGPLLTITLTWGFFYLLAGVALLILPEYHNVLGIDRVYASLLLAILGVAIGIGSVIAGIVSGSTIDLRLVPAGAIGIVAFFVLLAIDSSTFVRVALYIGGAGIAAGLYLVPLQAAVQRLAPLTDRGRFIGTANAISFVFLLIGSVVYWLVRPHVGDVEHLFGFCAALMAAGILAWLIAGRGIGTRAAAAMHAAHADDVADVKATTTTTTSASTDADANANTDANTDANDDANANDDATTRDAAGVTEGQGADVGPSLDRPASDEHGPATSDSPSSRSGGSPSESPSDPPADSSPDSSSDSPPDSPPDPPKPGGTPAP